MDNNFNNFNQESNQTPENGTNVTNGTNVMSSFIPKKVDPKSIALGTLGALGAAVIGIVIWIALAYVSNSIWFYTGALVGILAVVLYSKLAKNFDIIGTAICVVITLLAAYLGTKFAYIFAEMSLDNVSFSEAKSIIDLVYEWSSEYKSEYNTDMIMSLVAALVGVVCIVVSKIKGVDFKKNK